MNKLVTAILQSRVRSTRLPSKVLMDLGGRPLLAFMIERIKRCPDLNQIILATTNHPSDDPLDLLGKKLGLKVVRGSTNDVLARYFQATKDTKDSILVRLTGDCPLIDPQLISEAIKKFKSEKVDYLSNCFPPTYPDGLDVEVFTKEALEKAQMSCKDKSQREHVTPWIRESGLFKIGTLQNENDLSSLRWTVDEAKDLTVVRNIVDHFGGRSDFNWKDVINLQKNQPILFEANKQLPRNEGASMSEGMKLWRRAKSVIPGGNMLLSKRSEMFLPDHWPSYFSRAKGCKVWDLEGKELIDMSIMGIGTNLLGYGNKEVDEVVLNTIHSGNMSTLNCPEEVWLAERLIELHPWAEMARLARTGGEANAIAIRIARAATGRDTVAICGYHGWHDWYLATNLNAKDGLDSHLLKGLEPKGVPTGLKGSVKPFEFNRLDQLEKIINSNQLAAIKMEVQRSENPDKHFLKKIRKICTEKGIVLIFDECTSGFRETFGGLHLKYGINPDMAIFGKALGNGYAITAVLGKRNVMEAAQTTFISSTFWTERIGPTAAIKTLEVMKRERSWEQVTQTGRLLKKSWKELANSYNLKIKLNGLDALAGFSIENDNFLKYKTFITQEMLKKGYLAGTSCYVCTQHTKSIIDKYLENLEKVIKVISKCERDEITIDSMLDGPTCHNGFNRLN